MALPLFGRSKESAPRSGWHSSRRARVTESGSSDTRQRPGKKCAADFRRLLFTSSSSSPFVVCYSVAVMMMMTTTASRAPPGGRREYLRRLRVRDSGVRAPGRDSVRCARATRPRLRNKQEQNGHPPPRLRDGNSFLLGGGASEVTRVTKSPVRNGTLLTLVSSF